MEKNVKIYVSSAGFLTDERKQVEDFVVEFGNLLEENYNTGIQLLTGENHEDCCQKIRESDLCVFLCSEENEESIKREFEFAADKFEENYKSRIYTFFKRPDTIKSDKCGELESILQKNGCFYNSFECVDVIKFRIICAVKFGFMEYINIETIKEKCYVEGKEFLNLNYLPELKNYEPFIILMEKAQKAEKAYKDVFRSWKDKGISIGDFEKQGALAKEKRRYNGGVANIRKRIFALSLDMLKYRVQKKLTYLQFGAQSYVFAGDYERAADFIDTDECLKKLYSTIELYPEDTEAIQGALYDILTVINIMCAKKPEAASGNHIDELFESALCFALKTPLGSELIFNYIEWKYQCDDYKKAMECFEKFSSKPYWEEINNIQKAQFYRVVANIYRRLKNSEMAEQFFDKQKLIYKELKDESPVYLPDFALSYFDLGEYYFPFDKSKAVESYEAALELYEALSKINPARFVPPLSYVNLKLGYATESEVYFAEAMELAKKYSYNPLCAMVITSIGINQR